MTRYAMIIDLHSCVGCGTCDIVCKLENLVPEGVFMSYHATQTSGEFPDVSYSYTPLMCNHCANAACVGACPTGAMHKDDDGLTVCDSDRCISCGACAAACPYGAITPAPERTAAADLAAVPALIEGCTSSGGEVQNEAGNDFVTLNPALAQYGLPRTEPGAPLKCQMCKHLVYHGGLPRCVEACPAGARIFGNEEDIYGEIYALKEEYEPVVLNPEAGTEPHVYYIRQFEKTW